MLKTVEAGWKAYQVQYTVLYFCICLKFSNGKKMKPNIFSNKNTNKVYLPKLKLRFATVWTQKTLKALHLSKGTTQALTTP